MNYYKITNKTETHNGLKYKTGLNKDPLPFYPGGNCEPGGIYFSREDILAFLNYGPYIRKVTLPKDAQVYKNPGTLKKWKADKVYLGRKRKITVKIIKELIAEGAHLMSSVISWAANNGHLEIVKLLLKHKAPINSNAISWAARNRHLGIVKLLLQHKAPIDSRAIYWAAFNGYLKIVKLLLEHKAPIDSDAISWAVENGHLGVVKLLKNAMRNKEIV